MNERDTCTTTRSRDTNIFRWYRSGWGRYSQSDPIGLRSGANLFQYGDTNPNSFIDPLGASAQVVYHPKTNEDVHKICGSGTFGCAKLQMRAECSCVKTCKGYRPFALFGYPIVDIYYSTDYWSAGEIMYEEERHLEQYLDSLEDVKQSVQEMRKRRFQTKEACEGACDTWKEKALKTMEAEKQHWFIDRTHRLIPRDCDGTINWM